MRDYKEIYYTLNEKYESLQEFVGKRVKSPSIGFTTVSKYKKDYNDLTCMYDLKLYTEEELLENFGEHLVLILKRMQIDSFDCFLSDKANDTDLFTMIDSINNLTVGEYSFSEIYDEKNRELRKILTIEYFFNKPVSERAAVLSKMEPYQILDNGFAYFRLYDSNSNKITPFSIKTLNELLELDLDINVFNWTIDEQIMLKLSLPSS